MNSPAGILAQDPRGAAGAPSLQPGELSPLSTPIPVLEHHVWPAFASLLTAGVLMSPGAARARTPTDEADALEIVAERRGRQLSVQVRGGAEGREVTATAFWPEGSAPLEHTSPNQLVGRVPRKGLVGVVVRSGPSARAAVVTPVQGPRRRNALLLMPSGLAIPAGGEARTAAFLVATDARGRPSRHVPLHITSKGGRLRGMTWVAKGVAAIDLAADSDATLVELQVATEDGTRRVRAEVPTEAPASADDAPASSEKAEPLEVQGAEADRPPEAEPVVASPSPEPPAPEPAEPNRTLTAGAYAHAGVDTWRRGSWGAGARLEAGPWPRLRLGATIRYATTPYGARPGDARIDGSLTGFSHGVDALAEAGIRLPVGDHAVVGRVGVGPGWRRDAARLGQSDTSGHALGLATQVAMGARVRVGQWNLSIDVGTRVRVIERTSGTVWPAARARFFTEVGLASVR